MGIASLKKVRAALPLFFFISSHVALPVPGGVTEVCGKCFNVTNGTCCQGYERSGGEMMPAPIIACSANQKCIGTMDQASGMYTNVKCVACGANCTWVEGDPVGGCVCPTGQDGSISHIGEHIINTAFFKTNTTSNGVAVAPDCSQVAGCEKANCNECK